jgi:hypothetical protein
MLLETNRSHTSVRVKHRTHDTVEWVLSSADGDLNDQSQRCL